MDKLHDTERPVEETPSSGLTATEFFALSTKEEVHRENLPLEDALASTPEDAYTVGYTVCLSNTDSN